MDLKMKSKNARTKWFFDGLFIQEAAGWCTFKITSINMQSNKKSISPFHAMVYTKESL